MGSCSDVDAVYLARHAMSFARKPSGEQTGHAALRPGPPRLKTQAPCLRWWSIVANGIDPVADALVTSR
jgi:hypothetical protein